MNRLLIAALTALALSGCGDGKQAKYDECLAMAEQHYVQAGGAIGEQQGCFKGQIAANCAEAGAARRQRIADEERCVKLYK